MIRSASILVVSFATLSLIATSAMAHRSGCHRWHSCPSDSGSYICGDTGYSNFCPSSSKKTPYVSFTTIFKIQLLLRDLGYNIGAADGLAGPNTQAAIILFQQSKGLAVNGRATNALLLELQK